MQSSSLGGQHASVPLPSPSSLAYRARLAGLISPLRRVRARVPFWLLAAHRIPTLWSLYRGLLRESPTEHIRLRVKALVHQNRHLTSTQATKAQLLEGYKWLDLFTKARQGDEKLQAVLTRYDALLKTRQEKAHWNKIYRNELAWQKRLRNRPILTGAYLRASLSNRPLPRMKPQPLAITMMIKKRRAARERRFERLAVLKEWRDDLRRERKFEEDLTKHADKDFPKVFSENFQEWERPLIEVQRTIRKTFDLDNERSNTPFPPELLEAIKQARRERIANKTREREREKRGEILKRTILRQNQGPPAHVLRKMTPEERRLDKVARGVSEVGYVGKVKKKLGFKLRDPEAWKMELGNPEDQEKLDTMLQTVRRENERRRRLAIRRDAETGLSSRLPLQT